MNTDTNNTQDVGAKPSAPAPLAVNATAAAKMMACGYSTFFKRIKAGLYPPAAKDGLWTVSELIAARERLSNTNGIQ